MNATTRTVIKSVAVSKSWKFRSIGFPMIQPTTTQNGICIRKTTHIQLSLQIRNVLWEILAKIKITF